MEKDRSGFSSSFLIKRIRTADTIVVESECFEFICAMNETEREKKNKHFASSFVVKDKIGKNCMSMLLGIRFGFIDEQRTPHFVNLFKC